MQRQLGDLAKAWDELVERQEPASPFMLSWWVDHAAQGTPAIVCCTDAGELVGGAAFELDRFGPGPAKVERVRFLGQGLLEPDHLDVIAVPERRDEVVAAVVGWLTSSSRMIDLDGLVEHSELQAALGARTLVTRAAPYLTLEAGTDPVAGLPGRLRNTINRTLRRFARDGIEARTVGPDDADRALATLIALHESRWEDDSLFSAGWDRFRRAAKPGIESGAVVVHELVDAGGEVVASEVELAAGNRLAFYQAGRLPRHDLRGSGTALKGHIIRYAADNGYREFDFLRGTENYKDEWASGERTVVRIRVGAGVTGRSATMVANAAVVASPRALAAVARVFGEDRADRLTRRILELTRGRDWRTP